MSTREFKVQLTDKENNAAIYEKVKISLVKVKSSRAYTIS